MGQKVYVVIVEDQKESYEDATADVGERAYTNLADAKQEFNKRMLSIENDEDKWWVAQNRKSVVKKMRTDRWAEYYTRYGADKLHLIIHEMELV
ncbi:MAG: hypothetical protein E7075_01695 [Bacteroidales bacterium]|nr:hypothetical protein [Bacteroidales bacterium]